MSKVWNCLVKQRANISTSILKTFFEDSILKGYAFNIERLGYLF